MGVLWCHIGKLSIRLADKRSVHRDDKSDMFSNGIRHWPRFQLEWARVQVPVRVMNHFCMVPSCWRQVDASVVQSWGRQIIQLRPTHPTSSRVVVVNGSKLFRVSEWASRRVVNRQLVAWAKWKHEWTLGPSLPLTGWWIAVIECDWTSPAIDSSSQGSSPSPGKLDNN